jgi:hypothetical protein
MRSVIVIKCEGLHIVGEECSDINCVRGGVAGDFERYLVKYSNDGRKLYAEDNSELHF